VNDNEIISKSKFKQFSIQLSVGSLAALFMNFQFPKEFGLQRNSHIENMFDITDLYYIVLMILVYNILNMIMCFLYVGSLNFVKFEQKHPVKSLIGRFSFLIPLIVLYFYIFYDILN
jgi:hypothetical protein